MITKDESVPEKNDKTETVNKNSKVYPSDKNSKENGFETVTKLDLESKNTDSSVKRDCDNVENGVKSPPDLEKVKDIEIQNPSGSLQKLGTITEGVVLEIDSDTTTPLVSSDRLDHAFSHKKSDDAADGGQRYSRPRKESLPPPPPYDEGYPEDEEDDDSLFDLPAELPPPPDGGWGWVIVAASFLCNMIVDGVAYSFAPYLVEYSEVFDSPIGTVSWIGSLLAGTYLSAGPMTSALTNRFGCRTVCIAGGIVSSVAYASTVFATSIPYLMVVQGFIVGLGFGMIYLPAVVAVGYYFESKRALATGIAVCGSGVGTMVFAPFVNLLISTYGWKGANLIISGIILNACWLGALMRPLEVPKMRTKDLKERLTEVRRASICASSSYINSDETRRIRYDSEGRVYNPDPGVNSNINLVSGGTSFALPTIEEGDAPATQNKKEVNGEYPKEKEPEEEANAEEQHDETHKLVPKETGGGSAKPATIKPSNILTSAQKVEEQQNMQRNMTQPNMGLKVPQISGRRSVPKIVSVPDLQRRMSRAEVINRVMIIPATSNASHTSLASMGRRPSRLPSDAGPTDAETGSNLRLRRKSSAGRGMSIPVLSRQDIFYGGSIQNLPQYRIQSQGSMVSYRESTFNLQATAASQSVLEALDVDGGPAQDITDGQQKTCCPAEFCGPLRQMVDVDLLKNPVFLIIGVANMFGMLGFYTPFVYLPNAAKDKGISQDDATFLVSIIGVTNTIGRVLAGMIADRPWASALWINNISLGMSAVCVFLTPFATNFAGFAAIAFFFGFFVSAYISLSSIILVDLLGLAHLTNSFGILILCRGIFSILGTPIAGSIYDATLSYNVSFWSAGVLLFIACFLHCLIPLINKYCRSSAQDVRMRPNTDYLDKIPEEDRTTGEDGASPDAETADRGIIFDIKPKTEGEAT